MPNGFIDNRPGKPCPGLVLPGAGNEDTVTTVHPSFSTTLDNGNVLVVKNGYKDPMVIEINQNKEVCGNTDLSRPIALLS